MSRRAPTRTLLLIPALLAAFGGCQDATGPQPRADGARPQLAQGENDTWTVNSLADPGVDGCDEAECTLREAIDAAVSGGTIVFAAGLEGTINLANRLTISLKSVTVEGGGRITLDGQDLNQVPLVESQPGTPDAVTLRGLTLRKGRSEAVGGGAIFVQGAALTLDGVLVTENRAILGGGIVVNSGEVTIRNSTVSGNRSRSNGGGIFIADAGIVHLINSSIDGNEADDDGGGLLNRGTLNVLASTVSNNEALRGGGLASSGTLHLIASTVSNNLASSFGGGISNEGGTAVVRSATLTRNRAAVDGGGIAINMGNISLANSIIAGNDRLSPPGASNCSLGPGSLTSHGYNLTNGCFAAVLATDVVVPTAQIFTHVLEQELEENGGPTKTHALIARGLAVDAGYCPAETSDQRGFSRPVDDPTMPNALDACDIGAYEIQGPVAAVADLMVSQAVNRTRVRQGDLLTYLVRVQNLGPQSAPNVVVNHLLSSGVTFVSARSTTDKGTFTAPPAGETGTVTWYVGELLDQANEVAEIEVTVRIKGKTTITSTALVTGDVADPNEANNSASITVSVDAGIAGGSNGGPGGGGNGKGPKQP